MKVNRRSSVPEDGAGGPPESCCRQTRDSASRSTRTRRTAALPEPGYPNYKCTEDPVHHGDNMTEATNVQSDSLCDSDENTLEANLKVYADVFASTGRKANTIDTNVR